MKQRKVIKNDVLMKYSDVCPKCLSEFKEGQDVVIRDEHGDVFHLPCYEEKCQQK